MTFNHTISEGCDRTPKLPAVLTSDQLSVLCGLCNYSITTTESKRPTRRLCRILFECWHPKWIIWHFSTYPFHTVCLEYPMILSVSVKEGEKRTGVIWLKSLVLLSWATYAESDNSGLSVAVPKYFFPAATAKVFSWAFVKGAMDRSKIQNRNLAIIRIERGFTPGHATLKHLICCCTGTEDCWHDL